MRYETSIAEETRSRKPVRETATSSAPAVTVHTLCPGDQDALRAMFSRLSPESIYLRFHMPYPSVPEWMLAFLISSAVRRDAGESLVAVVGDEVVGHAMYVRSGGEAELAVVVEDAWQSKGIGRLLLTELAARARRRGVETFTAEVLGENRRMIGLLRSLFGEVDSTTSGGSYHARASLRSLASDKATAEDGPRGADGAVVGSIHGPSDIWSKVGKRRAMDVDEVSRAEELAACG